MKRARPPGVSSSSRWYWARRSGARAAIRGRARANHRDRALGSGQRVEARRGAGGRAAPAPRPFAPAGPRGRRRPRARAAARRRPAPASDAPAGSRASPLSRSLPSTSSSRASCGVPSEPPARNGSVGWAEQRPINARGPRTRTLGNPLAGSAWASPSESGRQPGPPQIPRGAGAEPPRRRRGCRGRRHALGRSDALEPAPRGRELVLERHVREIAGDRDLIGRRRVQVLEQRLDHFGLGARDAAAVATRASRRIACRATARVRAARPAWREGQRDARACRWRPSFAGVRT